MSALDGWIDVCRTGTWRDMHGREVEVGGGLLQQLAAGYGAHDPAPVVVGHPKNDAPAYAWVDGLRVSGDRLQAKLRDVQPAFRAAVEAGRYANRSIRFKANRLVHLGFLGGAAPAVPGLAPTQFAADEDATTVCLADDWAYRWAWDSLADLARRLRERLIEIDGMEVADKVVPARLISDFEEASAEAKPETSSFALGGIAATFGHLLKRLEAPSQPSTGDPMDPTEEQNQREAALNAREASLAAREASAEAAERLRKAEASLKPHVDEGRLLPAEVASLAALIASLPTGGDHTISFAGEAGAQVSEEPAAILDKFIGALPKRVNYGTLAAPPGPLDGGQAGEDNDSIAAEATALMAEAKRSGTTLSAAAAVDQVRGKRGLTRSERRPA